MPGARRRGAGAAGLGVADWGAVAEAVGRMLLASAGAGVTAALGWVFGVALDDEALRGSAFGAAGLDLDAAVFWVLAAGPFAFGAVGLEAAVLGAVDLDAVALRAGLADGLEGGLVIGAIERQNRQKARRASGGHEPWPTWDQGRIG